jgi:hypothetical protein
VKSQLTFSDLLEAVRRELGNITNIKNSILSIEFGNHLSEQGEFGNISSVAGF